MNNENLTLLIEVKNAIDTTYKIELIYSKLTWDKGIPRNPVDQAKLTGYRTVLEKMYHHLKEELRLSE